MLRKIYLTRYKDVNQYSSEADRGTDNHILEANRPLKENDINSLPQDKLDCFVDEVLTNGQMNSILYNSNAQAEIKILKKTNASLKLYKKKKITEKEPVQRNIGKIREKKEIINQAQSEVQTIKKNTFDDYYFKTKKNQDFYKLIQEEKKLSFNKAESYKTQRILGIFENIQKKLNHDSVTLPNVKLDISNVYSRLYHNAVFIPKNDDIKYSRTEENSRNRNIFSSNQKKTSLLVKDNLRVKNVLESSSGKEFTLKITDELLTKCFIKHSGGPSLKKINDIGKIDIKKSNLNTSYNNGNTLLHLAVTDSQNNLINYLLEKGVDVNSQNHSGDTALHIAIRNQNKTVIQTLMNYKADINVLNFEKKSPFDLASAEIRKLFRFERIERRRSIVV